MLREPSLSSCLSWWGRREGQKGQTGRLPWEAALKEQGRAATPLCTLFCQEGREGSAWTQWACRGTGTGRGRVAVTH